MQPAHAILRLDALSGDVDDLARRERLAILLLEEVGFLLRIEIVVGLADELGPGLSAVWYRVRFAAPSGAADRPLLIAASVDDYGEIVVGGEVRATAAGFNGVLVAALAPAARHELLILGVNGPLGRPPTWPIIRNEVFVRSPVRVVVDGTAPRTKLPSGGRTLAPTSTCGVTIGAGSIYPIINDLDDGGNPDTSASCSAAAVGAPRWLRYRVDGPTTMEVTAHDGYAEIWINGAIDLTFGHSGHGAMSTIGGAQRVALQPGSHRVDVLVWPGPFTSPARDVRVSLALVD